jgi:hypothetical protein
VIYKVSHNSCLQLTNHVFLNAGVRKPAYLLPGHLLAGPGSGAGVHSGERTKAAEDRCEQRQHFAPWLRLAGQGASVLA